MEDNEGATTTTTTGLDRKCIGKLDFNMPFLSTRRPNCSSSTTTVDIPPADACDRVPFSWEQTPGKPKVDIAESTHDVFVPLPKPPPARWLSPKEAVRADINHDYDDGFEGDVDDDFSDAIDVFSLSESVEVEVEDLKTEEVNHGGAESPSFMIQRFLPDATALAASSALSFAKHLSMELPQSSSGDAYCANSQAAAVSHSSYSSLKGCGLDSFFPWRIKHKPCGLKSPVISRPSPNANAKPPHHVRFRSSRKHLPHTPHAHGCFID